MSGDDEFAIAWEFASAWGSSGCCGGGDGGGGGSRGHDGLEILHEASRREEGGFDTGEGPDVGFDVGFRVEAGDFGVFVVGQGGHVGERAQDDVRCTVGDGGIGDGFACGELSRA